MNDALAVKERKLILVLDNLDRIGAAEALKIWSTLQTFLRSRPTPNADWVKQLWVLRPYDAEGIAALWSKPKAPGEEKKDSAGSQDGGAQRSEEQKGSANPNPTPMGKSR